MRVHGAQHEGPCLPRQIDVIAETAAPDHKPRVLLATHWLTYPLRHVALMSLALDPSTLDYLVSWSRRLYAFAARTFTSVGTKGH
jgi:hypothetical protein